uniref:PLASMODESMATA CALLOSE-BINDING PROTEIN 4-like n=1 Tax=Erigeron canadensis TaxID=72917 RepID=UPI001CB8AD45|nr:PLASMODESMATA CALLOSE-BINDING PROTEIN 4-like [Erigeron canadensis]
MGLVSRYSLFFILSLLLSPDSSFAKKAPTEAILPKKVLHLQDDQIFSSTAFTAQLDDIPIVQPTTPTGTPNTFSPTPFPPSTTTPTGDPTTQPSPSGFQPNTPTPFPSGPSGPTGPSMPMGPSVPMNPSGPTGQSGPTGPSGPSSSGGSWCIASPSASETSLQVALDYACGYGGADCSAIQPGATCYNPNTVRDHASYAFNAYYQKNPAPTSCSFGGVAQLTTTDPSSGSCHFAASRSSGMTPPTPPMPSAPTTPTISSPINPYPTSPSVPGGFSDQPGYTSSEPTGEPSSADSITSNLLLSFIITSLLVFLNRVK